MSNSTATTNPMDLRDAIKASPVNAAVYTNRTFRCVVWEVDVNHFIARVFHLEGGKWYWQHKEGAGNSIEDADQRMEERYNFRIPRVYSPEWIPMQDNELMRQYLMLVAPDELIVENLILKVAVRNTQKVTDELVLKLLAAYAR